MSALSCGAPGQPGRPPNAFNTPATPAAPHSSAAPVGSNSPAAPHWSATPAGPNTPATPATPAAPVTIVIGVPQSRQIDPTHNIETLAATLAFERLTSDDAGGRVAPRILERWTEAADGLSWRLVLKPQLKFQDASPLAAADIKRQIDEARRGADRESLSVCARDISDVTLVNDRELVVRLSRRCAFLLEDLDQRISRPSARGGPDVGTGPFAIASSTGGEITLDANPHFQPGPSVVGRVVVKAYDTLRTAWVDMMRGSVDFLWEVGPDAAELLRDQSGIHLQSYPGYYAYTVIVNSARPALRNPVVRQALNIGVDRAELVHQALAGRGLAGDDSIWPSFWARDNSRPAWRYDPAKAASLIEKAGGSGARPSKWPSNQPPALTFTCLLPQNFAIYERLALLVQRQWRAIGVDMRIDALPADVYNRRIERGEFDAVLTHLLGGPHGVVLHRLWHSPGVSKRWNFWGYADRAVDLALDRMREAADDEAMRGATRALQEALRENPPAIVLAWSEVVQAVTRRFDLPADGAGRDGLHSLSRWTLRSREGGAR
ncbi:MAG: ABC transporter substrate-binding protein [Acidobacteriota bacterium]